MKNTGVDITTHINTTHAFRLMIRDAIEGTTKEIQSQIGAVIKHELQSHDYEKMIEKEIKRQVRKYSDELIEDTIRNIFWDDEIKEMMRPIVQKIIVKQLEDMFE